jgi:hypothetical protein
MAAVHNSAAGGGGEAARHDRIASEPLEEA